MRGVHTFINDIRRQVFTEVARMAFEDENYSETIRRRPVSVPVTGIKKFFRKSPENFPETRIGLNVLSQKSWWAL